MYIFTRQYQMKFKMNKIVVLTIERRLYIDEAPIGAKLADLSHNEKGVDEI